MKIYLVGVCPNNLNGNHIAWCHSVKGFNTKAERDAVDNALRKELYGTCNTTHCWEEEVDKIIKLETLIEGRRR